MANYAYQIRSKFPLEYRDDTRDKFIQSLSKIDDELCQADVFCQSLRTPLAEGFMCPLYDILVEWSFAALMNLGGSGIERRHVEWIISRWENLTPEQIQWLRHFLLFKYRFVGWR